MSMRCLLSYGHDKDKSTVAQLLQEECGNFYRTQVYVGSDLWVRVSKTPTPFADFTDKTLVDEDTNSIPTDNADRAIQGNVAMQATQPGG